MKKAHFTTCETIQLHDLQQEELCRIMEDALDVGIVTMGGGGDFPRNVMCSPLSGVEADEYFDVRPWAEAAGEYLMTFINAEKMPRKLKVCFLILRKIFRMQRTVILVLWQQKKGSLMCTVPVVLAIMRDLV